MDDSEAGDRAGSGHESDGTPLDSVNSNGSMAPESAPERTEARAGSAFCDEPAHPHAVEGGPFSDMPVPIAGDMKRESVVQKEEPGVTTDAAKTGECPAGQLGLDKFTEKFTKMVTGAEGGPWPSGDGEAVEQLNLQDLHDLNKAVLALKLIALILL